MSIRDYEDKRHKHGRCGHTGGTRSRQAIKPDERRVAPHVSSRPIKQHRKMYLCFLFTFLFAPLLSFSLFEHIEAQEGSACASVCLKRAKGNPLPSLPSSSSFPTKRGHCIYQSKLLWGTGWLSVCCCHHRTTMYHTHLKYTPVGSSF